MRSEGGGCGGQEKLICKKIRTVLSEGAEKKISNLLRSQVFVYEKKIGDFK